MAFTIGSGTFTNGSATVTGVTLTSGTLAYFASGTRMVVGVNPVIQEVEAIAAPTVSTITLRSAWTGTGGTYSFLANQTSEGLRDAVQAIRTNNASLQSFIDSIDTAATANSVAQRDATGQLIATNLITADKIIHDGDTNTSIRFPAADTVTVETNGVERLRVDSSGNVGVGTNSPERKTDIRGPQSGIHITDTASAGAVSFTDLRGFDRDNVEQWRFGASSTADTDIQIRNTAGGAIRFSTPTTERMRIDSSGNVLVGKTGANALDVAGHDFRPAGHVLHTRASDNVMYLNRTGTNGDILSFYKNTSSAGAIGYNTSGLYIDGEVNHTGLCFAGTTILPRYNRDIADDTVDFGTSEFRFDDIYATNGTIQTSDRNEKQDIEELSEAEHRVAIACKSLLRKFRWKSSVQEKGDDARIHFGIIAQDLQAAFEAEGLDAGQYAMFIHTDWWEHEVEVPAVEAQDAVYEIVTDEDGNETEVLVSEAVEAVEAHTRTETYFTEEEAPEGAVKKSRMGVRYSELLAFIIAGI